MKYPTPALKLIYPGMSFLGLWLASCSKPAPTPVNNGQYFPQVKQIIQAHCITCHQPGGQGMPTDFTIDDNIVSLAAKIKAAVADPVSPTNKRMPQGGPDLSEGDVNIIVSWYNKGGKATD